MGVAEKLSELRFLMTDEEQRRVRTTQCDRPSLYGVFCCANKFAGKPICSKRSKPCKTSTPSSKSNRHPRFSMGGASAWQFATHHAAMWAAAAPVRASQKPPSFSKCSHRERPPPWWEQVLGVGMIPLFTHEFG
jgi:hypothetical protein